MKLNKAFKFRIYPNKEQVIMFAKTFGCVRFIYNKMLSDKITVYKETEETLKNTPAQYKNEFTWLKEVDSLALSNAQLNLEKAYKNFFRDKKVGFPKFKSRHHSEQKYTTNLVGGNIKLTDGYLKLPKINDKIKVKQHRQIPENYKLKAVTVSKNAADKYYVSILFEYETEIPQKEINSSIGLDFSMKELFVDDKGNTPKYPRFYRRALEKLAKEQRKLSKCQKGSNNRQKQKLKVARLHEHIASQRKDFLHKQSRQIANAADLVCVENLNMKDMSRALKFGKSVHDNGWGMFLLFLDYKLAEQGKRLIKIDKWFPSSKTCSNCGIKKNELKLSERVYICDCGNILDRDQNAAINIKNEGLRQLSFA